MAWETAKPAHAEGTGSEFGDRFPADRGSDTKNQRHSASSPCHVALSKVSEQRLRHLAEQVHELGPAPLCHLLRDLQRGADFVSTLEAYAALPADFIRELGGARYAAPLHAMDGGRA